jgi:hypothetical protein
VWEKAEKEMKNRTAELDMNGNIFRTFQIGCEKKFALLIGSTICLLTFLKECNSDEQTHHWKNFLAKYERVTGSIPPLDMSLLVSSTKKKFWEEFNEEQIICVVISFAESTSWPFKNLQQMLIFVNQRGMC